MNIESMRVKFEAWHLQHFGTGVHRATPHHGGNKSGLEYWGDSTNYAWEAWLAANVAARELDVEAERLLRECKRFMEDMHAMPVEWTIKESQVLHEKVSNALAARSAAQGTQAESAPVEADPPLRNEWHRRNRPWTDYLEGTKARESWAGGGFWQKTSRGWRWHLGGTFPTPGAADEVLLPSDSPNSPVGGKD